MKLEGPRWSRVWLSVCLRSLVKALAKATKSLSLEPEELAIKVLGRMVASSGIHRMTRRESVCTAKEGGS
jgi:hypothetical protein